MDTNRSLKIFSQERKTEKNLNQEHKEVLLRSNHKFYKTWQKSTAHTVDKYCV